MFLMINHQWKSLTRFPGQENFKNQLVFSTLYVRFWRNAKICKCLTYFFFPEIDILKLFTLQDVNLMVEIVVHLMNFLRIGMHFVMIVNVKRKRNV